MFSVKQHYYEAAIFIMLFQRVIKNEEEHEIDAKLNLYREILLENDDGCNGNDFQLQVITCPIALKI